MLPAGATGASMGVATGQIVLDTSQLAQAVAAARNLARSLEQAFGQVGTNGQRVNSGFSQLTTNLRNLRGELVALSAGAGLLTGMGLRVAGGFEEADIKLSGMTGGIAKAQKLTAELRKQAQAAGLPFQDMLNMATRLLPTLGGNTKELEKWYDIVKRTAVLNAQEGITGAAFSINEALSSGGTDLVSLVERFNISRVKLKAALAATGGDFRAALDQVLNSMGITTEVAERMGQSFNSSLRVTKDAAFQLLAEGFTPLLQLLTPLLQKGAQWLAQLRETNPAVAQLGAGLATLVTVGAPAVLLFNQLVEAGKQLQALGILGGLGKAGGVGLSVAAGVGLGIGATNAIGRATGNEQMANAGTGDLLQIAHKLVFNIAWVLTKAFQGLVELFARFTNAIGGPLDMVVGLVKRLGDAVMGMIRAAGTFIAGMAALLPKTGGDELRKQAAGLFAPVTATSESGANALAASDTFRKKTNALLLNWANSISPPSSPAESSSRSIATGGPNIAEPVAEWAKAVRRIEAEAGEARLQATRDYERQRSETIAQYELSALREAEDFARQRARQEANYQRQIAQVQEEAAKREAAWQRDLNEKLAELRNDSNERLAELEEDYAKDRERRERDHRERLLDAAARLDAVAVREEQRRYADQTKDAEENYQDQRSKIQEALDERIADELKAHQRRLEDQRQADVERLADMKRAFEEQRAEEDFERAIRLQRQAEDHAKQLEQMDIAQAERLAQIDRQAAKERAALEENFLEQLQKAGLHRDAWLDLQKKQQEQSLKMFQEFWVEFNKQYPNRLGPTQGPMPGFPTSWSDFGYGEAAGQYLSDVQAKSAAAGGSSRSITIAEGAIVVNTQPTQDERAVARQVRSELANLLTEMAK